MELIIFIVFISTMLCGSEKPTQPTESYKKIILSDDVLDNLNEIEGIYKEFIKAGMSKEDAATCALKWQDTRHPIVMYPLPRQDYKKEETTKKDIKKDPKKETE